ncbi:hypothetical protein [Klebsiella quasipneumoniae]|uniref:hypothetical protein n=1 Tax=Klebsiella pneumoniae complex TaxID=3390273 RepID=UPI00210ADE0E|nr:hypothetical protein [Klebsiella quasipneumoniae]MCQ3852324.1 hypothetical protein [Klebsiella quasipneumoniae]
MTNNQLTDERVTSVIERLEHYACNLKWTNVRGAQDLLAAADGLRELQERRKAAMDSEPVAWTWHYREQWHVTNDERRAEFVAKDGDVAVLPLYRHAQPAQISEPVLPLQDKDLQGVIDALEHPAGINAAGKQVVRHALVELQERRKADSEPYGFTDGVRHGMIYKPEHSDRLSEPVPVYRHAQPVPVVSADLLHTAASAIEDLLEHTDPNTSYYSGVWADVPGKLRAAMFQAKSLTGNSPVIGIDLASGPDRTVEVHYVAPPGYVMVPKEPTEAMMLHNSGCQHHAWDDPDCAMRQTRRLIWSHMLAAAPQEVK